MNGHRKTPKFHPRQAARSRRLELVEGEIHAPKPINRSVARRAARTSTNWRIIHPVGGDIIALEPGREFENVFTGGPDPFWEAVQYAAAELRKAHGNNGHRSA